VFRNRHARMVERVIGRRVGTGGTGVDYLEETARYRVFKDLWAARTFLVRRDAMPPLRDLSPYLFRDA
jgi:tryptophan 2,3-dioxygenase